MVWDLRGAVKFAMGTNTRCSARAGSERRGREGRPQSSGGRRASWFLGSPRTRLLPSKGPIPARPWFEGGGSGARWVVRCARRRRAGAAARVGQAGGRGSARSPHRAHPRARTLHTHLEVVPAEGRGGPAKRVS